MLIDWLQEQKKIVIKPKFTEELNNILENEKGKRKRNIVKKMGGRKDFPKEFEFVNELLQRYEVDECSDEVSMVVQPSFYGSCYSKL